MDRSTKTLSDAVHLLQLSELLTSSVRTIVEEWAKESHGDGETTSLPSDAPPHILPSRKLHQAQRRVLAIAGSLTELVSEPPSRIIEVACQYWESRALYLAAERRIPDLLAAAGDRGLSAVELGEKTGVEPKKLCTLPDFFLSPFLPSSPGNSTLFMSDYKNSNILYIARLLRCLCSIHIFREIAPDQFKNNGISASLVNNEPLRAYVMLL